MEQDLLPPELVQSATLPVQIGKFEVGRVEALEPRALLLRRIREGRDGRLEVDGERSPENLGQLGESDAAILDETGVPPRRNAHRTAAKPFRLDAKAHRRLERIGRQPNLVAISHHVALPRGTIRQNRELHGSYPRALPRIGQGLDSHDES